NLNRRDARRYNAMMLRAARLSRPACVGVAVAACLAPADWVRGQGPFTVTFWNLTCGVQDGNGSYQDVVFRAPPAVLPFVNSHQALLPGNPSSAGASYAISADPSRFDFQMSTTVAAGGNTVANSHLDATCTGTVHVTATVDTLMSVDGSFTY